MVVIEVLLLVLDAVPLFLDVFVVVLDLLDHRIVSLLMDGLIGGFWGLPWQGLGSHAGCRVCL